jgi:putative ABC transport system permease protein
MFKHYLTTALRHFRQHKTTTTINVVCLAFGLTCFICAWGIYAYLTQSDRDHANAERLHVFTERVFVPGTELSYPATPSVAWSVADLFAAEHPDLKIARASMDEEIAVTTEGRKTFMQTSFVDDDFLELFDFRFSRGDARNALREPRSAVISAALAARLFGATDPMGKTLLLNGRETVHVRGVIESIPSPSHMSMDAASSSLHFEALVSMDVHESLRAIGLPPAMVDSRYGQITGALYYYTYVLTSSAEDAARLKSLLPTFADRHLGQSKLRAEFDLRPIAEIPTLGLDLMTGASKSGIPTTKLLLALGLLVLLVSCLNYTNLEAAQADMRTKEIALRRIVGANRRQVFLQCFVEASLLTCVAITIAIAVSGILMAVGVARLSIALMLVFGSLSFWITLFLLAGAVSLLASAYPSLVLTRVRPAQGVRSKRSRVGSKFVASLLVGSQFVAASFLLITVLVMWEQNNALRRVGAFADPVVMIANDMKSADIDLDLLRSELDRQPNVKSVSATMAQPFSLNGNTYGSVATSNEAGAFTRPVVQVLVDFNFESTLDMKLLAGRSFDRNRGTDGQTVDGAVSVLIDESLATHIGAATPAAAIDRIIYMPTSADGKTPPQPARVVGVVATKPLTLMGLGSTSTLYLLNPTVAQTPLIRLSKDNIAAGLAEIDAVWDRLAPNIALKRRFLDEQFEINYQIFQWLTNTFAGLAAFAFVIGAMGLVGMAIHVASRRMHEIGVRKTLGAKPIQIVTMMLSDFCRPIVIANLIAWPIAFLAVQAYLSVFAHRIELSILPFALSLIVVLLIACLAVLGRVIRASRLNPATVLRYE